MIFEYRQTSTHPNVQQVTYNNLLIGTGSSLKHFSGSLNLSGVNYELTTDSDGRILFVENGAVVGEIREELKSLNVRKIFDKTIIYYEFVIKGRAFEVFHITFLKKDHNFYQIEENGKTVAIVQKSDKVYNYNHRYTCYAEEQDMLPYIALWCLFLQSSKYFPFMIIGEGNVSNGRMSCSPKHVREKYDPTFIPRVKALDGVE